MENIPAIPETKAADVAGASTNSGVRLKPTRTRTKSASGTRAPLPDPITEEKVTQLGAALDAKKRLLDELVLKGRRPALGSEDKVFDPRPKSSTARRSTPMCATARLPSLKRLEEKALSVGSGADGGYLVPEETEREIGRRLVASFADPRHRRPSPGQRQRLSQAVPDYRRRHRLGRRDRRAAANRLATFAELAFPTMELYAMPAATQTLLDDSAVNIDEWIAAEVDIAFAEQEGTAFVSGDGANKPKGFLAYDEWPRLVGVGQARLRADRRRRRLRGRPTRPIRCSISSMR